MLPYANPSATWLSLSVSYSVVTATNGDVIRLVMPATCFLGRSDAPGIDFTFTVSGSPTPSALAAAIVAALTALGHANLAAAVTGVATVFNVHAYDVVNGGPSPYLSGTALTTGHITTGPVHSFYVPNRSMLREKAAWDVLYDQAVAERSAAVVEAAELRVELAHVQGSLSDALARVDDTPVVSAPSSGPDFVTGLVTGMTASLLTRAIFNDQRELHVESRSELVNAEPFWRT